jgi:carnosine synthase
MEDPYFDTDWLELGDVLHTTGRPQVIDRRGQSPNPPPPRPSACLVQLGQVEGRWAMPFAGAQALEPGAVVWVLSTQWLSRDQDRLLCHRGLWADRSGQLYLDDFSPPRLVTYFANFLTRPCTYGLRAEGEPLEFGISCPQSSCTEILSLTACKVATRLLAGTAGVRVPHSVALVSRSPSGILRTHRHNDVSVFDASELVAQLPGSIERLRDQVERWVLPQLAQWPAWINRLIVKPSGLMHLQGRGVQIVPRDEPRKVIDAILRLMTGETGAVFESGDSVLIDAFVGGTQASVRVRVIASRTEDDRATALGIFCSHAASNRPIGGTSAWPQSLYAMLTNARIPGARRIAKELEAELRQATERTLESVFKADPAIDSKPGARTDLIGLDFIFALPGDTGPGQAALSPTLIEVNDHDCTDIGQIYGYTRQRPMDASIGSPQDHLLDTHFRSMMTRSQRYLLRHKRILLVGGATFSKRCIWERARACGVRLVLITAEHPAPGLGFGPELESVIVVPNLDSDHSESTERQICESVIATLAERSLAVDGVLCVWEDSTVLAARLTERLGLPGHPLEAQRKAKDKLKTREALLAPLSDTQSSAQPNPATLTLRTVDIRAVEDLEGSAAKQIGFPAVLRVTSGSAAVGTQVVRTLPEAIDQARFILNLLNDQAAAEQRYPGGFMFGTDVNRLFLCEYVDGNEYDVDLIMFEGELIDAWVTDNGVTDLPCCAESCEVFPSALDEELQQQLISAAWLTCQRLGLQSGAVNIELKFSRFGPRIIEVNGRMGGFYIPDWSREVWDLELPDQAMMIACGIRPVGRVRRTPRTWLAGAQIFAGQSANLDQPDAVVTQLGEHAPDPYYPEPIANIAYRGRNASEAVAAAERGLQSVFRNNPERADVLTGRLKNLLQGDHEDEHSLADSGRTS